MEELNELQNNATETLSDQNATQEVAVNQPDSPVENPQETTPEPVAEEPATEETTPSEPVAEEPATEEPEPAPAPEPEPAAEEATIVEAATPQQEAEEKAETAEAAEAAETQDAPEVFEEQVADHSGMSREELLEALRELLKTDDITKIKNNVADIKLYFTAAEKEFRKAAFDQFVADGGNKDEFEYSDDQISEAFKSEYNIYRERRQKHIDEMEAQKQKNLEQKQLILEELRKLIDSDEESLKHTYDEFNSIQDRWKSVGDVPRSEINSLWQNYHFLVEQFFNKVKINKELIILDQKKNLEKKTQLCEKAEELIVETSIVKAFKELQNLKEQWRETGPVPVEQNDEIWARFRNAASQIDERRKEYYEQRKQEQGNNLLAKQALVEKVKELTNEMPTTIKGWNDTSSQLDELLKVWKSIGPVPKEQNEEIWKEFKGNIDNFYTEKKRHFETIKDEQTENYNRKIDLCLQAEAIAKREDWKKATEELLKLQEEWKQTGAVNRKVSEKIWHRFRGACDEFFAKKAEYYNNMRSSEQENLQKKEAILAELKSATFGDDKEENLNILKEYQRRWIEVGFVPIAEKQRLQKDFRNTINAMFEQLKISAREAELNNFRENLRSTKSNDGNGKRNNIVEQIQKLRSDISLWENNLGFLANSKQADLLKEEFEKKMQNARQEIALLEAKLKIMDEEHRQAEAE